MKNILKTLHIVSLIFLTACFKPAVTTAPSVEQIVKRQDTSTEVIRGEVDKIDKVAPAVKPNTVLIVSESKKIDDANKEVLQYSKTVETNTSVIKAQNDQLTKDLAKEKESYTKLYNKWLAAIIIASGLGLAVSTVMFLMGNLKSLTMTLILLAIFGGAILLQVAVAYFMYIAIAVALIIILTIVYNLVVHKASIKEIVNSVDKAKDAGAIDPTKFAEIANTVQSDKTQTLVDKLQDKPNEGSYLGNVFRKYWKRITG